MKKCWRINCDKTRKDSKFHKASIFCDERKEIEWVHLCEDCYEKSSSDMSILAGMLWFRNNKGIKDDRISN